MYSISDKWHMLHEKTINGASVYNAPGTYFDHQNIKAIRIAVIVCKIVYRKQSLASV